MRAYVRLHDLLFSHMTDRAAHRVEFLERTLLSYMSLPEEGAAQCRETVQQNFADVWSVNGAIHARLEQELGRFREIVRQRDERIEGLEEIQAALEHSLERSRKGEEGSTTAVDLNDVELFFHKQLKEKDAAEAALRDRISELEQQLVVKEHECHAKQMHINHLLTLPNQLEHASEVNRLRTKLLDTEGLLREMCQQQQETPSSSRPKVPNKPVLQAIDLCAVNQVLWNTFHTLFRFLEWDNAAEDSNHEGYLYGQFLLDHPTSAGDKLHPSAYTRAEVVEAMRSAVYPSKRRPGDNGAFAACLVAIGARFKCNGGRRHWVNVDLARPPQFAWDKSVKN